MRPCLTALLLLLVVLLCGPTAQAQSSLTLAQAIELALRNHEDPQMADQRVTEAQAAQRKALALLLPTLTFTGSYTRRAREVDSVSGGKRVVVQAQNAVGSLLSLQSDVVDATNFPVLRAAEQTLQAVRVDATEVRRVLAFAVAEAFFTVLSAERLAAVAGERLTVSRENLALVEARKQAGLASGNQVPRAELDRAKAELAHLQTDSAVRTARLALGLLLGVPAEAPLLAPDPSALPNEEPSLLATAAEADRPDLQALRFRDEAARLAAQEPWLRLVPTLGLAGQFKADNEAGMRGRAWDWNVGLTLTWVLYDGGIRYAEAAARQAQRREVQLAADKLRRRIAYDIRQALLALETSRAAATLAERAQTVARQNADEVHERIRQGLATALDLADANLAVFESASELEQHRLTVRLSQLRLLQTLGRWPVQR